MTIESLRAFASRPWAKIGEEETRYWATFRAGHTALDLLILADGLRQQIQEMHPSWPEAELREQDLQHHIELSRALRLAIDAGP